MVFIRIAAFVTALFQMLIPSVQYSARGAEAYYTKWAETDEYKLENTATIEKDPNRDFVVLNLTDCQLTDTEALGKSGIMLKNTVKKLVEETEPDLITLTGDNAWGYFAYVQLINLIESFDVPWAVVMGNHDNSDENTKWFSSALVNAENCVFSFGPEGMGYGNYVVNVTENGKVVESLIFVDTHSNASFELENGSIVNGYDHLWANQIEWYKWAVNGVQKYGKNGTVKSIVFAHIPVVEYKTAYDEAWDAQAGAWRDGYEAFGEMNEAQCPAPVNNGFFETMRKLGSTTDFICGHDHVNNYSILYKGIRLTYALKTGNGCYWKEGLSGGTTLTLDGKGSTVTEHRYIEPSYEFNAFEPMLWTF